MEVDENNIKYKVRAKNKTYYKETINKKSEDSFVKNQKEYYKSLFNTTQELKIIYLGTIDYDFYPIGEKFAYKELSNWNRFPEESYFGHVHLENKRLFWFGAMHYKYKYESHIEINGYPYLENYVEKEHKSKILSYLKYIKPLLIDIDETLPSIKLEEIYSKYADRIEPKKSDISHHPLYLNVKRKRSEALKVNFNYYQKKSTYNKLNFNQLNRIQYNDYSKTNAKSLALKIGVNYNTVHKYKSLFMFKLKDSTDFFKIKTKKPKVIPEIKSEIDDLISNLYPWNGPKEIKHVFDIRYPLNPMSLSWYSRYLTDNKFSYRSRAQIKSHSNSPEVKFQRMNCAFMLLNWMAKSKHLIYFDESYIDSNISQRYAYTKTYTKNYYEKDYDKKRYNLLYSVSDIGKLPFLASSNTTNAWTVLHYMRSVCEFIRDETNVRMEDCMWVVDDCNIHVAKFIIKEITEKFKMSITILPIGSSCIMASEYVFHILKDIVLPKNNIKKSEFEESTIDTIKTFQRKYELASMRLSYNNLLLSLDYIDLY